MKTIYHRYLSAVIRLKVSDLSHKTEI